MSATKNQLNECTKSELDLFYVPPTNTSIDSGYWSHVFPSTSIENNTGPIEFLVNASPEYIHLNQTILFLTLRFNKKSSSNTTSIETLLDGAAFGPVNNFASSLFSQIDVVVGDKSIETTNATYPYKAYITNLLNYGEGAKKSHLQSCMFYMDTPGDMESFEKSETTIANKGLAARKQLVIKGKGQVELLTRLHSDFFNSDRFLLNNIRMKVTLTRNKPAFYMMMKNGEDIECVISKAELLVRRVRVNPQIMYAHSLALQKSTAKYPIKRSMVVPYTIGSGLLEFKTPNLASTILPQRIIVGLVDHHAFTGDYSLNPFNFQTFNLRKLQLSLNSNNIVYPNGLDFDFDTDSYVQGYQSLFEDTGFVEITGNGIDRQAYARGYTLVNFDLSPDLCCGEHLNVKKSGDLVLTVSFKQPLTQAVTLIVYSEFENLIEIDESRVVSTDYA